MTNPQLINVTTDADLADALGRARAELKAAQDLVKGLELIIKRTGKTDLDGHDYHVRVAYDVETTRVNWKEVAAKLNPSRQLVTAHSKTSVGDRVTCTAHKTHA